MNCKFISKIFEEIIDILNLFIGNYRFQNFIWNELVFQQHRKFDLEMLIYEIIPKNR